jgi:hypothetical protein
MSIEKIEELGFILAAGSRVKVSLELVKQPV